MKNKSLLIGAIIIAIAALVYLLTKGPSDGSTGKVIIAEGTQPIAAPVYVAYAKGYFKDEGLNVELVSFPTGKFCLDALIGGKADFATVAETPIMHATFKDQPIRIIATIHRSRNNTYCVGRKDKGVIVPADLKDKIIAVPFGTNAQFALDTFLLKNSLNPKDLTFINLSPPEMNGQVLKGEVAAVVAWQPYIGRCEKALGDNGVSFSFDSVYQETYNIVTSVSIAEKQNEIVVKVLKALNRAIDFMKAKPDESIGIVAQRIGMEKSELKQIWPIYNFGLDLKQSLIETMTLQGKWAVKQGHQNGQVPDMRYFVSTTALMEVKPDSILMK
jgi:ABC-type nitrate/sulfonate/bicarbonate transport system substrate-binding protein